MYDIGTSLSFECNCLIYIEEVKEMEQCFLHVLCSGKQMTYIMHLQDTCKHSANKFLNDISMWHSTSNE